MYCCMSLPLSQIYDTLEGANLSDEDRRLCTLAIQPLKFAQLECGKFLMMASNCAMPSRDTSTKRAMLLDLMRAESSDFLSISINKPAKICTGCFEHVEDMFLKGRAEAWGKMPNIFQCQPWGDLERLRQSFMGDQGLAI